MNFSPIKLRQFTSSINLNFKSKFQLLDSQQCILDSLWCVSNPQDKLKVVNALIHYFIQINKHVDNNHFEFFVLVRGIQSGIYSQWRDIVDLIINYPNPYYRGFYTFHKAIEFAR